jgi:PAS domain S-box-containing protein
MEVCSMGVARAKSSHAVDLIDEELSLRALVDASDDAIIGKTIDGTIISWNKGAEKIYGYKAEEIIGQPISSGETQTRPMRDSLKTGR